MFRSLQISKGFQVNQQIRHHRIKKLAVPDLVSLLPVLAQLAIDFIPSCVYCIKDFIYTEPIRAAGSDIKGLIAACSQLIYHLNFSATLKCW